MALQPCRTTLRRTLRHALPRSTYSTTSESSPSFASQTTPSSSTTLPRWKQTPAGMKAPIQMDFSKNPSNKVWHVNNDPEMLDQMYDKLLGKGGRDMLPEELKWLAVTHKSFDQGRRGFNDKLALMGRMTLVMETTKDIVSQSPLEGTQLADEFGRERFEHEQLQSVDNLIVRTPQDVAGKDKLYAFGVGVGLLDVLRWKPRLPAKLESSGVEVVVNGALLAIIGAVTLQHGSQVASRVIREKILARLPKRK